MRSHSSSLSFCGGAERLALPAHHRGLHLLEHLVLRLLVAARDAGVVDQHLDVAEVRRHRSKTSLTIAESATSQAYAARLAVGGVGHLLRALLAEVEHRDPPALRARSPATSPRRARTPRLSPPRPCPRTCACRPRSCSPSLVCLLPVAPHNPRSTCPSATRPAPCRPCRPSRPRAPGARRPAARQRSRPQLGRNACGCAAQSRRRDAAPACRAPACSCPRSGRAATVGRPPPIVRRQHLLELLLALGMADVHDHHATRAQAVAHQLEELPRREVERDVGLAVDVDHDRVVARRRAAQVRPRVLVVHAHPRDCAGRTSAARACVSSESISTASTDVAREVAAQRARRRAGGVAEDRHRRGAATSARRTAARGTRPSSRRSGRSPGRYREWTAWPSFSSSLRSPSGSSTTRAYWYSRLGLLEHRRRRRPP